MSARITVRHGAVYLPASVADTYFRDVAAVVMLIEAGALLILPVRHMAAGGCLLKVRNAAGDRVARAPDVFDANAQGDLSADDIPARWSSERGALVADLAVIEN